MSEILTTFETANENHADLDGINKHIMKKKKTKLDTLKSDLVKVEKTYRSLQNAVEKEETRLKLPALKKQYEGKFWKYENSFGGDSEKWWYYSFCKKVINEREAIADCFQTTPYENEFHLNNKEYFYLFGIEITREEYLTALTEFLSKCNLMRENVYNETTPY